MLRIAFAGAFACRLAEPVGALLTMPHEIVLADEAAIAAQLAEVDMLVSLSFTPAMAAGAPRLKLVQVPGAGVDRIDRAALASGIALANAYGHETGIAEHVIGTMLALTRDFGRLDAKLRQGIWESQWAVDTLAPPLWPYRPGRRPARARLRHGDPCHPP